MAITLQCQSEGHQRPDRQLSADEVLKLLWNSAHFWGCGLSTLTPERIELFIYELKTEYAITGSATEMARIYRTMAIYALYSQLCDPDYKRAANWITTNEAVLDLGLNKVAVLRQIRPFMDDWPRVTIIALLTFGITPTLALLQYFNRRLDGLIALAEMATKDGRPIVELATELVA